MRPFVKLSLAIAVIALSFLVVPSAKAAGVTISSGGFNVTNLGQTPGGVASMDALSGAAHTSSFNLNGPQTFTALLNPLQFNTGFTGPDSGGAHPFTFSQSITINGQTQILNLVGRIDIDHDVDTVHILSANTLTFRFSTFSVTVNVLPTSVEGFGGVSYGDLKAEVCFDPKTPVPEPATLTLLGLGLAGTAAKLRQRRKRKTS